MTVYFLIILTLTYCLFFCRLSSRVSTHGHQCSILCSAFDPQTWKRALYWSAGNTFSVSKTFGSSRTFAFLWSFWWWLSWNAWMYVHNVSSLQKSNSIISRFINHIEWLNTGFVERNDVFEDITIYLFFMWLSGSSLSSFWLPTTY